MEKISILGLHLGYGGVEQSIINQANMLSKEYEVELVSIYKLNDMPAFKVNKEVKIIYLTNIKPNKEELKKAIKEKNIISIFKEGFKSLTILYKKYSETKKFIKNSDSKIIISSRVYITKILNKYAPKNSIKIAEEHCHHNNNEKYINTLKKACTNINYLLPVSKELTKFYKKNIPNVKCIYIPNSLDYWPSKDSNLDTKNIISIGRLSHEKGFCDLIDVFKIINDKDKNTHLDIIGDGIEYNNVLKKIDDYNLKKSITMHGFKNKEYIHKLLEKSSLYLMCSFEESFGIVLIEAGSFGIPALAFDSAQGASEIIDNNKNGYLIKNRDKELMAKKTLEILNDKNKLLQFGREAKVKSKIFSYENVQQEWLDFIKKVK